MHEFINTRLDANKVCFWDSLKKLKIDTFKVTTQKISLKGTRGKVNFERLLRALRMTAGSGENKKYQPQRDPQLRIILRSSLSCTSRWDDAKDSQEGMDADFGEKCRLHS